MPLAGGTMIRQLTSTERHAATIVLVLLAMAGVAMAAGGRGDPLAVHGLLVMLFAGALLLPLLAHFHAPEPTEDRRASYYDDPIKVGIVLAMAWGVFGMFMGVWVAAQLAWPDLAFDAAWSTFGRLRPTHTTGVIFGFGGNALIATSFHVVQRTSRARLAGQFSPWFVLFGYNLFCLLAVSGYMLGVTQSKEYAEAEWYADFWLVIVWVTYFVLFLRTIARRREPHIYVANWYFMAFIVVVAILHIVNNLAVPVSWGTAKSYTIWPGVQDAMVQWWYGHNAVAFFLTAGFLGMLYYYLPVRAQRPIFSYRLSILSFWGITFFYMWAGSHHLHYTALPHWVQTLGMTFSVMLLVPSWASAGNALLTLNGAWHRVRDDATLRFMMAAAVFYGLSTFEGSFLAIRPRRSAGLGGADHLRLALHPGPGAVEARAHVFARARRTALLALHRGHADLRGRHVELRNPAGADVAHLYAGRRARLSLRGYAGGHVSLLHRPRLRRLPVPDRRGGGLLQHVDDGARRPRDGASGHRRAGRRRGSRRMTHG
jgi:cytochrome c oxidase cbb3-type subunit 1